WLDGVYASEPGRGRAEFCEHDEVSDGDVAGLVSAIRARVLRYLRRVDMAEYPWCRTTDASSATRPAC
ncbi:MAG TPA: hypothetical protein VF384_15890, partial [Planctomycetota bacterium]